MILPVEWYIMATVEDFQMEGGLRPEGQANYTVEDNSQIKRRSSYFRKENRLPYGPVHALN